MNSEFPSVLVIGPSTFNYLTGSGVTFSHLFQGWPKSKLASLYTFDEPQDKKVCERFFRLGANELKRFPFAPKRGAATKNQNAGEPAKNSWKKKLAGNSGWPESFQLSPELLQWLEVVKPQVVYTILGPISMMEAALSIRERFGSKLVIHHMDDWYKDAYTTGLFRYQRRHMLKLFHSLVEIANERLTICDDMAEEYSHRFQNKFRAFQNTIDVARFHEAVQNFAKQGNPNRRTLLYFGSILSFAQEQSILDTADIIIAMNEHNPGNSPILRIIAPQVQLDQLPKKYLGHCSLELVAMINDPSQFEKEIAAADVLLLPANFGDAAIQGLRFSMPTKLPGYLASGKPILAYSPSELAQSKYLAINGIAEIVSERSQTKLAAGIESVMNPIRAKELSIRAYELALSNHDSATVRTQFQRTLRELAK